MLQLEQIKPINGSVLVQRYKPESELKFGELKIFLPEEQDWKNRRCKVLATHDNDCLVSPGQDVELIVFDGIPLGDSYPNIEFCNETNILCIVKEDYLIPLHNRIAVAPDEIATETAGGIALPELKGDKPFSGTVVGVGEGRRSRYGNFLPLDIEIGDKVYFTKYKGTPVKVQNKTYMIVEEEDILTGADR